jgi:hypothetical protein
MARAVSARYDRRTGRIVLHLSSRLIISFAPRDAEGLKDFPALDADIYIPALLERFLGSKAWMASRPEQMGGRLFLRPGPPR